MEPVSTIPQKGSRVDFVTTRNGLTERLRDSQYHWKQWVITIAGTTLGVLNGMGGLFGGLANNNCHDNYCNYGRGHCSDDQYVTRYDARQAAEIAAKDGEIALLKSNIYTDQKILAAVDDVNQRIRRLEDSVNTNTCAQAVTNQQVADNINFVNSKFEGVYKDIKAGDERVKNYVDCHFVPGKLVMPLGSICPPAMPACEPIAQKK